MDQSALYRHTLKPKDIGLVKADLEYLALTRIPKGGGFSYTSETGKPLKAIEQDRIAALAIPPAWQNVKISENEHTHILAYGEDEAGRRQYIYHPDWRAACETAKFLDLPQFARRLPRLRAAVKRDLSNDRALPEYAMATVVRLLDKGGLRVGSWQNETYGAVSLKEDHVEINGYHVELNFVGKGGNEREVEVCDAALSEALEELMTTSCEHLFTLEQKTIRAADINVYIREALGMGFSAKDFRTWGGSVAATKALTKGNATTIKALTHAAADYLGNTPSIARTSYIHPAIIDTLENPKDPIPTGPTRLRKYERLCLGLIQNYSHSALSCG